MIADQWRGRGTTKMIAEVLGPGGSFRHWLHHRELRRAIVGDVVNPDSIDRLDALPGCPNSRLQEPWETARSSDFSR